MGSRLRSARLFRASRLGDGPLSDLRAKLAREEAVEEAQGAQSGAVPTRWQLTSQAQDLVAAPFQRAREGEADAPRASLYLKGLTANTGN